MRFGSLFAGIGGFDLGLERAGMECAWQVEIDPFCRKVLEKHWPNVKRYEDVREVGKHNLEPVDLICGGFPCQDISYAGSGAGLSGKRSGLWFEFARIIGEVGPRFVAVENVAALVTRGLDAVLGTLADLGFDAEWGVVPASAFGSPQYRERLFLLAYSECNGRLSNASNGNSKEICDAKAQACGHRAAQAINIGGGDKGVSEGADSLESRINDFSHTRLAPWQFSGAWNYEPDLVRVVDGVPVGLDRLRTLGNAIVPQVAEWIGRKIMDSIKPEATDCDEDSGGV